MEPLTILRGTMPALVYSGHDLSPTEAVDEAMRWLEAHLNPWGLHAAGKVAEPAQAWWAGEAVGFCGDAHPDAVAVTVVNLPGVEIP